MRDNLIETLRDCANALGELLPRDHAYRKIVDQANRLLDRHDQASEEQRATDALRDLMSALPKSTQTSMTVFKPEVDGQKAGAIPSRRCAPRFCSRRVPTSTSCLDRSSSGR